MFSNPSLTTRIAIGKAICFTNETVPDKLLNHHDLQAGTWGLLTVEAGTVSFFRQGDDRAVCGTFQRESLHRHLAGRSSSCHPVCPRTPNAFVTFAQTSY